MYDFHNNIILKLDILGCYKNYKNKYITIYDCLNFQRISKQKDDYCNYCNQNVKVQKISKIYSSLNVFIFSLDRGNLDQNLLNVPFLVQDKLNLNYYIEDSDSSNKYELIGIISIYIVEKKYVCFCKSPIDNRWHYYNDENVGETKLENVLNIHNSYQFIPCLLIYNYNN